MKTIPTNIIEVIEKDMWTCDCGFLILDREKECPRCFRKGRVVNVKRIEKERIGFELVLIPMYRRGIRIVESCSNGDRNPSMCNNCNIENCSRTKVYKFRQTILRIQGESDGG